MDIALEGVTENPTDDADIDGDSGEYVILEEFQQISDVFLVLL